MHNVALMTGKQQFHCIHRIFFAFTNVSIFREEKEVNGESSNEPSSYSNDSCVLYETRWIKCHKGPFRKYELLITVKGIQVTLFAPETSSCTVYVHILSLWRVSYSMPSRRFMLVKVAATGELYVCIF